jgi:nitrite reductase (NO-forming)
MSLHQPLAGPGGSRGRGTPDGSRLRWHLLANSGVVGWLLALVVVSLLHRSVPQSGWLLVHLLLLGAVTNAILVWSTHFAHALLKNAPTSRRGEGTRLVCLNVGVAAVVAGIVSDTWLVTLTGAVVVATSVAAHGISLARMVRTALPSRFGASVRYYLAASAALPVGAALGTVLARGLDDRWHGRVVLAHLVVNVLGWVGLTVLGTLLTLWPTILRTRIVEGAERRSRQALPVLVAGIVVAAGAALAGVMLAAAAGLLLYLAGAAWAVRPVLAAARNRPPQTYAAWSVLAATGWLVVSVGWLAVLVARSPGWAVAGEAGHEVAVPLAAGFAAQVLLGAMTYLVPVVLGGGPARVRATTDVLERAGVVRVVVANLGLVGCLLPVPSMVRVVLSVGVLLALAAFLPLLVVAVRLARRPASSAPEGSRPLASADRPVSPASSQPQAAVPPRRVPVKPARHVPEELAVVRARHTGMAAVAVAAVVLAVTAAVAADPTALGTGGTSAAASATATGRTTTVHVQAKGMRFHPASVEVPVGNRVVIEVTNADRDVHDLALESGQHSGRLAPGASGRLVVPVVGRSLDGWCTIAGHRQMGMVFAVHATGTTALPAAGRPASGHHDMSAMPGTQAAPGSTAPATADATPDFMADPPAGFEPRDASLPPAPTSTTHRVDLTAREVVRDVGAGVRQRLWTFNGTVPGPVLHGHVGDRFVVTLHNAATMSHSIDLHAFSMAPDEPTAPVAPGQSHTFSFTATRAGIWMYHCSSMPMSLHIANGMFGAVVIDPPGLPRVDREYVLVQSELYLGPQGASADAAKVAAERPDAVVFNGVANQYDHAPLTARAGERVRIWVLDAGPNRGTSFHVVGGQFDTVFSEGAYVLRKGQPGSVGGAQALALQPAQGGFVELTPTQAGRYPFVSHVMVDAERGAHGVLAVTP